MKILLRYSMEIIECSPEWLFNIDTDNVLHDEDKVVRIP